MRAIGEVVAISLDDKLSVYGRIEGYDPDKKPRWYQVHILLLTFPPQNVTWILREEQVDGEPFTMDGVPVKIQPVPSQMHASSPPDVNKRTPPGTVISLAARAKPKPAGNS